MRVPTGSQGTVCFETLTGARGGNPQASRLPGCVAERGRLLAVRQRKGLYEARVHMTNARTGPEAGKNNKQTNRFRASCQLAALFTAMALV